jgi:pimeloyl-ACP methyl ester carboxylesterase
MVTDIFYSSADGLRLFYRDYAGGAQSIPVLCLPGLTRNSRDFAGLAEVLSPRHRVLTPDLRGRGRSAWDPHWQNYHPGTYVGDVRALIAHAQLDRFVIVGTSLGGILAMLIAASSPQRVAGIVLNDVGPEVAPDAVARISQYVGRNAPVKNWHEAAEQARATYGAALPDYSNEDWLGYARRGYSENSAGIPVLDMDPKIGDAVRAAAGAGPAPDLWPLWTALRSIPMLAIRGEHSDVLSRATLTRMAQEHPGMETLTVPNRGHAPTLDEGVCIAAIERFLLTAVESRSPPL